MAWKTRYGSFAVRTYTTLIDPVLRPVRPKVVHLCRELGARDVLDIASATGAQCRALARAGIRATGVDLSRPMIAHAMRRGGKGMDYVLGSAYALPFPSCSFDASLLVLALHEHTEQERAVMLKEAVRVLRSGGVLIVAEYVVPPHRALLVPWGVIRLVEHVAGGEHRAGFRDFVARGGLDGLIERHALRTVVRTSSHFGTIGIAATRSSRGACLPSGP